MPETPLAGIGRIGDSMSRVKVKATLGVPSAATINRRRQASRVLMELDWL